MFWTMRRTPFGNLGIAILVSLVMGLMPGLGLTSATAAGTAARIPFSGAFYTCGTTPPVAAWESGNVLHFRGATNHNQWVTGNELVDGFTNNVVDGDINLKNGTGVARPRESLKPAAVDGTWEINVTVRISASGVSAYGVGRGTGDLHGMTIKFRHIADFTPAPGENPCSDILFGAQIEGEVLMPASTD